MNLGFRELHATQSPRMELAADIIVVPEINSSERHFSSEILQCYSLLIQSLESLALEGILSQPLTISEAFEFSTNCLERDVFQSVL